MKSRIVTILATIAVGIQSAAAQDASCRFATDPAVGLDGPRTAFEEVVVTAVEVDEKLSRAAAALGLSSRSEQTTRMKSAVVVATEKEGRWVPSEYLVTRQVPKLPLGSDKSIDEPEGSKGSSSSIEAVDTLAKVYVQRWLAHRIQIDSEVNLSQCESGAFLGNLPGVVEVRLKRGSSGEASISLEVISRCQTAPIARGTVTLKQSEGESMEIRIEGRGIQLDAWTDCAGAGKFPGVSSVVITRSISPASNRR